VNRPPAPSGLVIVDKPAGMTSHDVVARVRKLAGTRRVGHAGTLDPMATGVLVIGVERATRLLTYLVGADKSYQATIRLGIGTVTDDQEGAVTGRPGFGPGELDGGPIGADLLAAVAASIEDRLAGLRGSIQQVPSAVSAIKVDGKRSYTRVREGEQVELAARPVTVHRFDVLALRPGLAEVEGPVPVVDLDVEVVCSSGTYVRALARDLGARLETAGHLTALRRTRVGAYPLAAARTLESLTDDFGVLAIADAARAAFPARELTADEARRLAHGQRVEASELGPGPVAAFAPDGSLVALIADAGLTARALVVLTG
jgi:tRNA pseudouridine55 synthase